MIEDTASNPATALEKMKLLQQKGVSLFIGPSISAELEACAEYANSQGLFIVSPGSTSMNLAKKDNIFRFMLNDEKQAKSLAKYIYELGYKYIEPVYRNDVYGRGLAELFAIQFKLLGGDCGNGVAYDANASDFTTSVQEIDADIASAGNRKKAVLMIAYDEYVQLMDEASAYSSLSGIRWFGTDSTALSALLAADETASVFALKTRYTASMVNSSNFNITPYVENLKNELLNSLGSSPTALSINSCDAAWFFTMLATYLDWSSQYSLDAMSYAIYFSAGYLQANLSDDNGDRLYGNYALYEYSVPGETDTPNWKINAQYIYFLNREGLTWLDEEPVSQTTNWEIYK